MKFTAAVKQRTLFSLCGLAVLALFVMTATNRSESFSGLRGLQNAVEANSTTSASASSNSSNANATAPANNPVSISVDEARNNTQIYNAFLAGNNQSIARLQQQGKIPAGQFNVVNWTKASYLNTSDGVYYNFTANLDGPNYVHLLLEPTVFYSNSQKTYRATTYFYRATNYTRPAATNNTNNSTNNSSSGNSTNDNTTVPVIPPTNNVPVVPNNTVPQQNNTAPQTNTTQPQNGTNASSNAYTPISVRRARNNTQIYRAFLAGNRNSIARLQQQGKIPSGQFNVTQWTSASYRNTSTGVYYNFTANLAGPNYVSLLLKPTVFYSYSQKNYRLVTFFYRATNYTRPAASSNNSTAGNSTASAGQASQGNTTLAGASSNSSGGN